MATCDFSRRRQAGFTYIGLMILVAIISLVSTAALQVGALTERRAAEEELLEIGAEIGAALGSYAKATPQGQVALPRTLQDLLRDRRYPQAMRHLRKLYVDPLTGKEEWGLVFAPDGSGITGVYSLSDAAPIKQGNFDGRFPGFNGKSSYRYWVFKSTS